MAEEMTGGTTEGATEGTTEQTAGTTEGTASTTTPAAAPAAAGSWMDDISDPDLKDWLTREKIDSPVTLAESYRGLQKLTGAGLDKLIQLPAEQTAENMRAVFEKLGAGKTVEDYVLPVPEGDDGEFAKVAAGWMYEAAITTKQAELLAQKWNEHIGGLAASQTEAQKAAFEEQVADLKQEWGGNYTVNEGIVDQAAVKFGMTQEQLDGLKTAMGPKDAMNFLLNIGSKLGVEDGNGTIGMGGSNGSGGFGGSPSQAKAEIQALRGDPGFVKAYSSGDADARARMERLHRIAYPE